MNNQETNPRSTADTHSGTKAKNLVVMQPVTDHLVVMRESSAYNYVLMEGMIEQTLSKCSGKVPGADDLREIGIQALIDPEKYGGYEIRAGGTRAVVLERDGTIFLYSAGSAAARDVEGDNAFVQLLKGLVAKYQPQTVWAAALTRLVRSPEFAGGLMQVMMDEVELVEAEVAIDLRTPHGKILWQVLAMISAVERDMIVARHTAGRINQWKRQAWIPSRSLPPGYRLDDDRQVHLDDTQVDAVRKMLRILADPHITPQQVCNRIGALGISNPYIRKTHGPNATYADVRHPSSAMKTLTGWLHTYETGSYTVTWPNPFPGVKEVGGVPVEESDKHRHGVLRFEYTLPLPEGGWASGDVFAAASTRRRTKTPRGGAAHRDVPPLAGSFRWSDKDYEYATMSRLQHYLLYRRPQQNDRDLTGWAYSISSGEAEHLATIRKRELHRSIATTVAEAIRDGVGANLLANQMFWLGDSTQLPDFGTQSTRLRTLERRIEETERRLRRAHSNARLADHTESAQRFVADTIKYERELKKLQTELKAIQAEANIEPTLGERFESNAGLVAAALANLATIDDTPPADRTDNAQNVRKALATILSHTRFTTEGKEAHWSLHVQIPVPEGIVSLGPITGTVANTKHNPPADNHLTRTQRRKLVKELVGTGINLQAARVLANCPHRQLVDALAAHLSGAPDTGLDKDLLEHLASIYTKSGFRWMPGVWRFDEPPRQKLLDLLLEANGELSVAAINAAGIDRHVCARLSRHLDTPTGTAIVERVGRWGVRTKATDRSLRLRACPHCGGWASLVCLTPETPEGVLCPTCRRMPTPDSPTFPECYLDQT